MNQRKTIAAKDIKKGDLFSTYRHSELMSCSCVVHTHDPMTRNPMVEVYTGFDWMPFYLKPTATLYIKEKNDAK